MQDPTNCSNHKTKRTATQGLANINTRTGP